MSICVKAHSKYETNACILSFRWGFSLNGELKDRSSTLHFLISILRIGTASVTIVYNGIGVIIRTKIVSTMLSPDHLTLGSTTSTTGSVIAISPKTLISNP